MDIPVANTVEISVNPGTIINDNSNNLICTDIEPRQLTNQTASLETECIMILQPRSRRAFFTITIPNSTNETRTRSTFFSSPDDYKIKIMFLLMFLIYTSALFFIIFLLNHDEPMKD